MYKVFLSYSHEDRDFINYLALDLQSTGVLWCGTINAPSPRHAGRYASKAMDQELVAFRCFNVSGKFVERSSEGGNTNVS